MFGGSIGDWDVFVWGTLWSGGFLVLVCGECLVHVVRHADVPGSVEVVLFDGDSTEQGTRQVNGDVTPLLECVDEVFGMVGTNIFNAKIINY